VRVSNEWIGAVVAIVATVLAFVFGRMNLARATEDERQEAIRHHRIEAYATFCSSVVEYRRSQLTRWYAGQDHGGPLAIEQKRPGVAADLRASRAAAWSAFYRVLMISDDESVVDQAKTALVATRSMKDAQTVDALNDLSNDVHAEIEKFAHQSRATALPPRKRQGIL